MNDDDPISLRTCSVSSALFGIAPVGLSQASATMLRQWLNAPAHITHESNSELRLRYGVLDPVDALARAVERKLAKLQQFEPDITNSYTDVTAGVPCNICGLYFL